MDWNLLVFKDHALGNTVSFFTGQWCTFRVNRNFSSHLRFELFWHWSVLFDTREGNVPFQVLINDQVIFAAQTLKGRRAPLRPRYLICLADRPIYLLSLVNLTRVLVCIEISSSGFSFVFKSLLSFNHFPFDPLHDFFKTLQYDRLLIIKVISKETSLIFG